MRATLLLFIVLLTAQAPEPSQAPERAAGAVFDDCENCPEMVVVPAGRFTMGSTAAQKSWAAAHGASAVSVDDEAPQRKVSLHSFALAEYDVTREQYAVFVQETGHQSQGICGWQSPGFAQSDLDPVVCVSWQDTQAYIAWLNQKAGAAAGTGPYRLPTEAEWEYAARARSATLFWWGDDALKAPEHAWYEENSGGQTHPVGGKPANDFGLYDITGNVWQWTQDCYVASYANAPANGRAVDTGSACQRVDRGGSWRDALWLLRSSTRAHNPADFQDRNLGFRVARSL
jgi:sulfatase modifying factor 1